MSILSGLGPLALATMQFQTGQNEGAVQARQIEFQHELQQANLARQLAMEQMMADYRRAQEQHLTDLGTNMEATQRERASRDAWQQGVAQQLEALKQKREGDWLGVQNDIIGIKRDLAGSAAERARKARDWDPDSPDFVGPVGGGGGRAPYDVSTPEGRARFLTSYVGRLMAPRYDRDTGDLLPGVSPDEAQARAQQALQAISGAMAPAAPKGAAAAPAAPSFADAVNSGAGGAVGAYNAARAAGADPATALRAYQQAIAPPPAAPAPPVPASPIPAAPGP